MTTEDRETHTHNESSDNPRSNGGSRAVHSAPTRSEGFAHRAKDFLSTLPGNAEARLARHPYRALGIAFAVGAGAGIVFGSRILRAALVSAASIAIVELGRNSLRHVAEQEFGMQPGKSASASSP